MAADSFLVRPAGCFGMAVVAVTAAIVSVASWIGGRPAGRGEIFTTLVRSMDQSFCVIEMIHDESAKPTDYRFLDQSGVRIPDRTAGRDHPCVDGNKRAAFAATYAFLAIKGARCTVEASQAIVFVVCL